MNYWLMKSEPDAFSYDDLVRKGKAEWDGVRNHAAQLHMKAMRKGDLSLFYHRNIGVEAVGIMEIVEEAADVEPVRVGAAVQQLVDRTRVPVEREDDVGAVGEQLGEVGVGHAIFHHVG